MLPRNVLIFHTGALGDFVLSWPLALGLARLFPQSRIFYVTQAQKGKLAERVLRVDWTDAEAGGWHALFAEGPPALPEAAERLIRGAHTIVSFGANAGAWAENVKAVNPAARLSMLSATPPDAYNRHIVDHWIEQWSEWRAAYATVRLILKGVQERGLSVAPADRDAIVIHPGSGSPAKNWAVERFIKLATRLIASGRAVRFVLGEVEIARWPAAEIARFAAVAEVRRPPTYVDLLAECSRAQHFIGNDSGPAHLAAIVGIPTIALFGLMSPRRWKPIGPHVQAIDGPLDAITVDQVLENVQNHFFNE